MIHNLRSFLLAGTALAILTGFNVSAEAGGFALREQSAAGQGASFAGVAAGGALSSMYWNPAVMTQFAGKTFELGASAILPNVSHAFSTSALAGFAATYNNAPSNSGDSAFVPNFYASWQINPQLWLGMSVNSPFGLSVSFPQTWAGSGYAQQSSIRTFNASPTVAYQINDWISVAAGVQIQNMKVGYGQLATAAPSQNAQLSGEGFGYGYTLGTTITPTRTTTIGIGYRSQIDQKINGAFTIPTPATGTQGSVNTTLRLPSTLTIGLRQAIGQQFTLLAGFEWANWRRIGAATVNTPAGTAATLNGNPVVLPFNYTDGYFYSLGAEYAVSPVWTLRTGIAYEKSPITDQVRTPRLPDNDRMWYSVGSTWKPREFKGLTFDLGYSLVVAKDTPINVSAASGNPWFSAGLGSYIGSVSSQVHIISVAARYQWDDEAKSARRTR